MVSFQSNKNLDELVRVLTETDNFSRFTRDSIQEFLEKLERVEKKYKIDLRDGKFIFNVNLNGEIGKMDFNVNLNGEIGKMDEWTGRGFCSRAELIKIAVWSRILSMVKDEKPTFLTANELVRSISESSQTEKTEARKNATIS